MNVDKWMQRELLTVGPQDTLMRTWLLMVSHRIRHVPVVHAKGTLVGILSDRDIKTHAVSVDSDQPALAQQAHLESISVAKAMIRDVITVEPEAPMSEAALLMKEHRIDCLPVVQQGRVIGIVTSTDILDYFIHIQAYVRAAV